MNEVLKEIMKKEIKNKRIAGLKTAKVGDKAQSYEDRKEELEKHNPENLKFIEDYLSYRKRRNYDSLSHKRIKDYTRVLHELTKQNKWKDYKDLTGKEIIDFIDRIREKTGQSYSETSKWMVKAFIKWLMEDKTPKEVKELRVRPVIRQIQDEHVISEDELAQVLQTSPINKYPQIQAITIVCAKTGARSQELLSMKLKDVKYNSEYKSHVLKIKSIKTRDEKFRNILLSLEANVYFEIWLSKHPDKDNPESPLWLNTTGKPLTYNAWLHLDTLAKNKLGLHKGKFGLHSFRRHSATYDIEKGMDSMIVAEKHGWRYGSPILRSYIKISENKLSKEIAKTNGFELEKTKPKESKLKPKMCLVCGNQNPFDSNFCNKCKRALNETAQEQEIEQQKKQKLLNFLSFYKLVKQMEKGKLDKELMKVVELDELEFVKTLMPNEKINPINPKFNEEATITA